MKMTTRRAFLRACLLGPAGYVLAACGQQVSGGANPASTAAPTTAPSAATDVPVAAPTAAPTAAEALPATAAPAEASLPATPPCDDDDDATLAQTEGPYYTPNTPERASLLEPGMPGTRLVVSGAVLTTGCQPVARALIDFWQADDAGAYDNAGFTLRGHQFTDDQGRYRLETIMPGLYPGRTRHIHVRVQAPNQPLLTTQLYFPDEPANDRDRIFHPSLVMALQDAADGKEGAFDFVLEV
ncbi:MAG: dioxygenase [Chloroflexota bacterium]|jgi:protocatechuate 3,4-dioxygenase beta subunit